MRYLQVNMHQRKMMYKLTLDAVGWLTASCWEHADEASG